MTKEEFYWNVLYSQWDKREEANKLFIAEDRVKPRKTQSLEVEVDIVVRHRLSPT